jgi:hypothetical protein
MTMVTATKVFQQESPFQSFQQKSLRLGNGVGYIWPGNRSDGKHCLLTARNVRSFPQSR